jgi:hypothetical protein
MTQLSRAVDAVRPPPLVLVGSAIGRRPSRAPCSAPSEVAGGESPLTSRPNAAERCRTLPNERLDVRLRESEATVADAVLGEER